MSISQNWTDPSWEGYEIWQQHIFRRCFGGLAWASVCQSWQLLVCGAVTRFTPRLVPYSDRLYKSLTKFTQLRALYLDTGINDTNENVGFVAR